MDTTPGKDSEPFDPLSEGSLDEPEEEDREDEPATTLENTDPSLQ